LKPGADSKELRIALSDQGDCSVAEPRCVEAMRDGKPRENALLMISFKGKFPSVVDDRTRKTFADRSFEATPEGHPQ
jgi:hypothetical protein